MGQDPFAMEKRIPEVGRRVGRRAIEERIHRAAAEIAFFQILGLVPFLAFLLALLSLLPDADATRKTIDAVRQFAPQRVADLFMDWWSIARSGSQFRPLSLGALFALFFGSNGMGAYLSVLNRFERSEDRRPGWKQFALRIPFTLLLCLLVGLGVLSIVLAGVRGVGVAIPFFVGLVIFYRLAAPVHRAWSAVAPGALLATVLLTAVSSLFAWYIDRFDPHRSLFGGLASLVAFLLWLQVFNIFVLLGGLWTVEASA